MNRLFGRMDDIMSRAAPVILTINWAEYIPDYNPIRESGAVKGTGIMTFHNDRPITGAHVRSYGTLLTPEATMLVIAKKLLVLGDDQLTLASIERRNPEGGIYGGGIRYEDTPFGWALSGLPEIADHVVGTNLMAVCHGITEERRIAILSLTQPGVAACLAEARMGLAAYDALCLKVLYILKDA